MDILLLALVHTATAFSSILYIFHLALSLLDGDPKGLKHLGGYNNNTVN
jgi:hypothetical protein